MFIDILARLGLVWKRKRALRAWGLRRDKLMTGHPRITKNGVVEYYDGEKHVTLTPNLRGPPLFRQRVFYANRPAEDTTKNPTDKASVPAHNKVNKEHVN